MTESFQNLQAVLFDIDGVLVDSKESNAAFLKALVQKAGYPEMPKETLDQKFHTPLKVALRELLHADEDEVERIIALSSEPGIRQPHLLSFPDGLQEILEDLAKQYRLGVVTSRMRRGMSEVLELANIHGMFEVLVGYEDVLQPKPHPEPLLVALERLGLSPEVAVYIGDGHSDIDAAHAAGMRSIFLSPHTHEYATMHIQKFNELRKVLL